MKSLALTLHAAWIGQVWCLLTNIFTWSIPREISKIFGSDPEYLKWASQMLHIGNLFGFINYGRFLSQGCLQSLQMGGRAMIVTFTCQFLALLVFAFIFYYTNKHDPVKIAWCYPLSYLSGALMGGCMIIGPLIRMGKLAKEEEKAENEKAISLDSNEDKESDELQEIHSSSSAVV